MGFLSRFFYTLWYFHHPPWDSGIVPPEVVEFIHENPPGRALELGCGTGTSTLALAAAGWRVTGVDFVPGAIALAKRKARNKSLAVDFRIGNVTRLHNTLVSTPYDLILDIGCFHGLSPSDKRIYLDQLPDLLVTGGTWLMYGFINEAKIPGSGLLLTDIELIKSCFHLAKRQDGVDKKEKSSAWFWFIKEKCGFPPATPCYNERDMTGH